MKAKLHPDGRAIRLKADTKADQAFLTGLMVLKIEKPPKNVPPKKCATHF